MSKRIHLLQVVIFVCMSLQSASGLLLNPYRDIEWIALSWMGNDAVTLFLVCPLFAASLTGARPVMPRWQLLRIGLLGYAIYNYAFYMLGSALNAMFPLYIALFVAAMIALMSEFSATRLSRVMDAFSPETPVRLLGGFLVGLALGLSAVWLIMWGLHVFNNRPVPGSPEVFRLVAALDLGFMVPVLVNGGVLLWRRNQIGYSLSALAAIQSSLYLLVLSVNSVLAIYRGLVQWPGELPMWASLCISTGVCVFFILRNVDSNKF